MTHSIEDRSFARDLRDESGMALLIAVIVLLLMSALALSSLEHAGSEAMGSGSARRKDATLYAAESGQAIMRKRLEDFSISQSVSTKPISYYNASAVTDGLGNPIEVSTGKPENGGLPAAPVALGPVAGSKAKARKGDDMRIGGHNSTGGAMPWQSDVTARDAGNGLVHVQIQYAVDESSNGSY